MPVGCPPAGDVWEGAGATGGVECVGSTCCPGLDGEGAVPACSSVTTPAGEGADRPRADGDKGSSSSRAGGAAECGLAGKVPGGAASATGAPHCSQNSPPRSSGPLQKRQTTAPGRATDLSKDFFNASSSISSISSPSLGRGCCGRGPLRGNITGVGAIFRLTVDNGVSGGPCEAFTVAAGI